MNQMFRIFWIVSVLIFSNWNVWASPLTGEEAIEENFVDEMMETFSIQVYDVHPDSQPGRFNRIYRPLSKSQIDLKNPQNPYTKIFLGLKLLRDGKYATKTERSQDDTFLNNEFDSIKTPFKFISDPPVAISINASPDQCEAPRAFAWVEPQDSKSNRMMFFCSTRLSQSESSIAVIAGAIVHETQHLNPLDRGHVTCSHGLYKGRAVGCDRNRLQKGAYNKGVEYDALVAKYGLNFHPALKKQSADSAVFRLFNNFDEVPNISTQYVLVQDEDGTLFTLKSGVETLVKVGRLKGKLFDRDDFGALNVLDEATSKVYGWKIKSGREKAIGEFANWANDTNFPVLDAYYLGPSFGMLSRDQLKYSFAVNQETRGQRIDGIVSLPFRAKRFILPRLCDGIWESLPAMAVLDEDGKTYIVFLDGNKKVDIFQSNECDTKILAMTKIDNHRIALFDDGRILKLESNRWIPFRPFAGRKFTFLSSSWIYPDFFEDLK